MRYLFLITTALDGEPYRESEDTIADWIAEVDARGREPEGDRLRPIEEAKTVRVRGGRLYVTDGPFAETKEWVAGYDVIDCDSMDAAVDLASRHPMARFGRIEVRELWPLD
ncbi:YciI family protein [Leifsonia sp. Le1]|uniref:YciI family protein n=1 Tax=Leifsonia sp. Le1 TaxID=3404918 RepID=UPI003EBF276E